MRGLLDEEAEEDESRVRESEVGVGLRKER